MPTANEQLFDINVQHAIAIERLKRGFARELIPLLNTLDENVREVLLVRLDRLGRSFDPQSRALEDMLRTLGGMRTDVMKDFQLNTRNKLEAFGFDELDFQSNTLRAVLPFDPKLTRPKANAMKSAINTRPFSVGNGGASPLNVWFTNMTRNDRLFLNQNILQGISNGDTTAQIVSRIMGRRGTFSASRAAAERLVRTAVNHTTNQAREVLFAENSDALEGLRWTAVLDSRTSIICSSRDGEIFPVGEGPRPPAHPNCRSIMTPVVDGEALLGNRPFVLEEEGGVRRFRQDARERAGETRWKKWTPAERNRAIDRARARWAAENIGSVPAETTYEQFLRRQSNDFQDSVLGPSKGKLFRNGLSIDEFVDEVGRPLNLEELRENNRALFRRLGLAPPKVA